jgi:hypothetical protein
MSVKLYVLTPLGPRAGEWQETPAIFPDVEHAIDAAVKLTTTPWRITLDDELVAEGHAKRVEKGR